MLTFLSTFRKETERTGSEVSLYTPKTHPSDILPPKNSSSIRAPGVQSLWGGGISHPNNHSSLHISLFSCHRAERWQDKRQVLIVVLCKKRAPGILKKAGSFLLSQSKATLWGQSHTSPSGSHGKYGQETKKLLLQLPHSCKCQFWYYNYEAKKKFIMLGVQ